MLVAGDHACMCGDGDIYMSLIFVNITSSVSSRQARDHINVAASYCMLPDVHNKYDLTWRVVLLIPIQYYSI